MPTSNSPSSTHSDSNEDEVVACHDVTRTYARGSDSWLARSRERPTVTALDTVSMSVKSGEIVGIEGPSGSGKSTLLHLIAALDTPTAGTIELDGELISKLDERARAKIRLSTVGMVFQHFHLLPALTAQSNVALPLIEQGVPKRERRQRAATLLEKVGLGDRLDHRPAELSGGEQQRVAIARALVTNPKLVVADEPTGELDTETGNRIMDLFETIADEGRAIVLASHDQATIDRASRLVQLRDGRVVKSE